MGKLTVIIEPVETGYQVTIPGCLCQISGAKTRTEATEEVIRLLQNVIEDLRNERQ